MDLAGEGAEVGTGGGAWAVFFVGRMMDSANAWVVASDARDLDVGFLNLTGLALFDGEG